MAISPQSSPTKIIESLELSPTKGCIQHSLTGLLVASKENISQNSDIQKLFQEITESEQKLLFLNAAARPTRMICREIQKEQRIIFKKIRLVVDPSLHEPKNTGCETNGSYFLFLDSKTIAGVYKPRLQARGSLDNPQGAQLRAGIPLGQECQREKLADVLNGILSEQLSLFVKGMSDFAVPLTEIDEYRHSVFGKHHTVGSFQKFIPECIPLDAMSDDKLQMIPADELVKAALFDLITLNNDRHLGNLLYNEAAKKVILIDHGACFPERKGVQDVSFGWMHLTFANHSLPIHFREYIRSLSPKAIVHTIARTSEALDRAFPKQDMLISSNALFVLLHTLVLLQQWVRLNPDLSIAEFSRGFCKESLPIVEIHYEKKLLHVPLDPKTNIRKFDTEAFCRARGFDPETASVSVSRKTIGGQFLPLIAHNFESMKSMFESTEALLAKTEKLHATIAGTIKLDHFQSVQEMCQKR